MRVVNEEGEETDDAWEEGIYSFLRGTLWRGMKCTAKHLSGTGKRKEGQSDAYWAFLFWAFYGGKSNEMVF